MERQQQLVRADLRNADLLPAELLADLPEDQLSHRIKHTNATSQSGDQRRTQSVSKAAATRRLSSSSTRRSNGPHKVLDARCADESPSLFAKSTPSPLCAKSYSLERLGAMWSSRWYLTSIKVSLLSPMSRILCEKGC